MLFVHALSFLDGLGKTKSYLYRQREDECWGIIIRGEAKEEMKREKEKMKKGGKG